MKPLKILLGNNTLSLLAGSETWVKTLALQLKKMGHTIEGFSPDLGFVADELKARDIPCLNDILTSGMKPFSFRLQEQHNFDYDLIIANHFLIVEFLRKQFPKTPIISTIHGILHTMRDKNLKKDIPAPEHPALTASVDQFVAVSEEVQQKLKDDYDIDAMLVRNFLDCDHYTVIRPVTLGKPKVFMVNTNYATADDPEIQLIKEVAKHYDARVIAVGQNFAPTVDVLPVIEEADVIFGMGRSVLEGVCAGRLGIVHGRWGTGGAICPEKIDELRRQNFSGRNSEGRLATVEELIVMIDANYTQENLEWGKQYIRREHNVTFAADVFIQTARMLLTPSSVPMDDVPMLPYRLAKDV